MLTDALAGAAETPMDTLLPLGGGLPRVMGPAH
jgi:hypothetical protein